MCLTPDAPMIGTQAPTKSSTEVQRETEQERNRLGFGQRGFSSYVFTGNFGTTTGSGIRGATFGG